MKAELFNHKCWIKGSNSKLLKYELEQILKDCDFTILGFIDHQFTPIGYTCIWLLSESHLAVHTYPEHNTTYLEITSCSAQKNEAYQLLINKKYELIAK